MKCQRCGEKEAMQFKGKDGNPIEARVNCPSCYEYLTGCFAPVKQGESQ